MSLPVNGKPPHEESQAVKDLRTFESDVSTGLNRIVEMVAAREAEIAHLLSEREEREAVLSSFDRDVQTLSKRADDAQKRSEELEQENRQLAERQAAIAAQEAEQRRVADQLQREIAELAAKDAEKKQLTDELEQKVAKLTDRCENAEAREKEVRKKAMAVISGTDYDPALLVTTAVGAENGNKTTGPPTAGRGNLQSSGKVINSVGRFNFPPPSQAGRSLGGEETVDAVRAPALAAVPMSPNVFVQTTDSIGNTFAPGQGLTCTPEYLHQAMLAYQARLNELKQAVEAASADDADGESFEKLSRALKAYVDESNRTMLALSCIPPGSDLRLYDELQAKARQLQQEIARVTQAVVLQVSLSGDENRQQRLKALNVLTACQATSNDAMLTVNQLLPKGRDMNPDDLAALLAEEMSQMHSAVSIALSRLEDIQQKARSTDKEGWKVEVDEKILASCKQFVTAIQEITEAAARLQLEIEAVEKGALSKGEFYKRNVRWAQGLISSAKEITQASFGFVKAADEAILTNGRLEEVIVWTEEVSAAVIRLAVASRIKAPRNSRALGDVMAGTRNVSHATAAVVLEIRQCLDIIMRQELEQQEAFENYVENLDFYKTNKEEMESKIKAKRLESELEHEYSHLRMLRKHHAKLVGGDEARRMVAVKEMEYSRRPSLGMTSSPSAFAKQVLTTTTPIAPQGP